MQRPRPPSRRRRRPWRQQVRLPVSYAPVPVLKVVPPSLARIVEGGNGAAAGPRAVEAGPRMPAAVDAMSLVSRFRNSQGLAAHSDANFGIKGTLGTP